MGILWKVTPSPIPNPLSLAFYHAYARFESICACSFCHLQSSVFNRQHTYLHTHTHASLRIQLLKRIMDQAETMASVGHKSVSPDEYMNLHCAFLCSHLSGSGRVCVCLCALVELSSHWESAVFAPSEWVFVSC